MSGSSWYPQKLCMMELQTSRLLPKWLKCCTADLEVLGSGPTGDRDVFTFWIYSTMTQNLKLRRRVAFMSFGGDIKLSAPLWRRFWSQGCFLF